MRDTNYGKRWCNCPADSQKHIHVKEERKEGFSAYPEIDALARRAFPGRKVSTVAAMTGNSYEVTIDGKTIAQGTSQEVREQLNKALVLLDR